MVEPIAVVGSSCRFPGGASSPSKLWQLLKNPRDILSDIPQGRLGLGAFYHEDGEHHGSTNVVAKAYLLEEDPRLFDAPFFNINPVESHAMDPQQRLLLESVYECIEAAGYPLHRIQGSATAVYVGCMTNDYHDIQGRDIEVVNRYHGTGSTRSILSNRISYYFDFRGPSVTMDTACSSSLAALHFAVQSLRSGESTSAMVGGVNLIFDSVAYISESKLHMLSPTSRSSMWDASADGYARGEGVSALMLKTLAQAEADGDHIECVIRETGMNQDGRTTGLTMPSGEAQATLIRETYARAGLDLRSRCDRPQYFEAHGTGTLAGDPQEAGGIYNAFFEDSTGETYAEGVDNERLFCGSIKTVIGHLEGCAGLAGIMKASLAVQHGIIPPNMLFTSLNPDIAPYYHRLQVPTEALKWPSDVTPRRASVNSFGFGGTNVHAIIEQYIPSSTTSPCRQTPAASDFFAGPLLLSACTGPSLATSIDSLADTLEAETIDLSIEELAFFTQTRRSTFQQRIYFPGGSRADLIKALRDTTRSATTASNIGTRAPTKLKWKTPGVLGVFTGQGAQWATMGNRLFESCHAFRESMSACEAALRSLPDAPSWSLTKELLREQSESRLHEAALSQPLCSAVQIALVDTLAAAGITFRGVVGHSSGEIAACYAAGLLSAEDAMRVAYYRGLHAHFAQGQQGQQGAMMAVGLGFDDAETFCERFDGRLSVAASNSPTSSTISGDKDAILAAKESLEEQKTFARLLKVDTAYHSSHMLPSAKPYLDSLKACNIQVRPQNDECIWISSVHGHAELLDDPEDLSELTGEYWVANMCQPVLFSEAVECSLWRAGPFDVAIEVGAHPALKGPTSQTISNVLGANAVPYTPTLQRGSDDIEAFSATLGLLWTVIGNCVDFNGWREAYLGREGSKTVIPLKNLPSYSWSHEQVFWKESRLSRRYRLAERTPHELLGRRMADDSDNEMRWRNIMKVTEMPWLRGHVFQKAILFPTIGYVAMAIEAASEIVGSRLKLVEIRDLIIPRALVLEDNHNGVETMFSVRRQPGHSDLVIETDFACHSSVNNGNLEKNCSGRLIIELVPDPDEGDGESLPARCPPRSGTTSMGGEAYYQAILSTTGLDYQGLFRGMKHIRRSLGFSSAQASWPVEEVGNRYLLHPGLLDVALQAILAAFVNPTRIPIRGSFLPSALSRLVFDPHAQTISNDGREVVFESDCFLTENTARSFEGDIHVFGPSGQCFLQVEGFRMDNWAETSAAEDRPIFSRLEYQPDLFYADASSLAELDPDAAELRLIEAINRASFYYLRAFFSTISESEVAEWTWDRKAFWNATMRVLYSTTEGKHPVAQKSWLDDTASLMTEYKLSSEFQDQADMKAIHVAGEHLAKVMIGEERPLEVYLREDVWAPLYSRGRYQVRLNRTIAEIARGLSHRFPNAKWLEVGAGSGGTTISVLEHIGEALCQYTFTDVSAGFFEKARERVAHTKAAAADRMAYKVLDLERDPLDQGFDPESQDVVIAANVLHATADLSKAVKNVRRLLKPGGYLLMLEVTGEYLEGLLLMGTLAGWWLGNPEGNASQPGLTLQGWDDLLRDTGFTGVDKHQSDVPDSTTQAVSVVVSQATDTRVDILRQPLDFLDDIPISDQVLIVGGKSLAMSKVARTISQQVARFAGRVEVVGSIEQIDPDIHLTTRTAVIAFCELERPFFSDEITETRLQKLQSLFSSASDLLWVTPGLVDDHGEAAMMIGLCRTLVIELDQLNLQFLNTTTRGSRPPDGRFIVEAFVRLKLGASDTFAASPILWSNEPELTLTSTGEVLIPRLKPDASRNARVNSAARKITKTLKASDMASHKCTAVFDDGKIHLEEDLPWFPAGHSDPGDVVSLQSIISVTLPHCSSAVLVSGVDEERRAVLAVVQDHTSKLVLPRHSVLYPRTAGAAITAHQLRFCAQTILAHHILAAIPPRASLRGSRVLVHGASAALVQAVTELAADQGHTCIHFSHSSGGISGSVRLHPRSSNFILQRSLPPNIGFVLALTRDDAVSTKLMSIFPGKTLEVDALLSEGVPSLLADLESFVNRALSSVHTTDDKEGAPIPAHRLPNLPASSLRYPTVVDWSGADETPLPITIRPIHGRGMFSADKSYLMVSLVSTLGRSICKWMIENGARHIALASRSGKVDPQWLEEMADLGAQVRVYRMDVSDKQSVQSTVATIRAEMPPIAGVANAALVLRDRLFLDMQASDMTEVLAPKVDGSLHLSEEFQDPTLDFFILFSTLSCVIGNAGQSNYDAASLYQVMLAKRRRQQGLPACVMEIGAVADVGYVAERGQALFDKLARTMKLPLSESDVHQIFAEAVAASRIRPDEEVDSTTAELVTGMGYYNYTRNTPIEAHPPWFNNLLASHYVREERGSNILAADTAGDHLSVAARLDATTSEEAAVAVLTQALADRVERMLQMSSGSFKTDASLLDASIDSLLAVELRTWFLKEIHVDVPVLKILSGESGEGICTFAASQYLAEQTKVRTEALKAEPTSSGTDSRRGPTSTSSSDAESSSPDSNGNDVDDSTSLSTIGSECKEETEEEDLPQTLLQNTAAMTHSQAREDAEIARAVREDLRTRKWRLPQGHALEIVLISHSTNEHTLLIGYHHIIMDGTSWRTFFRDLHMAYQGAALQAPGKSLMDVANHDISDAADSVNTFWLQELSPLPEPFPLLPFASAQSRPPLDKVSNHSSLVPLDGTIAERIKEISRALGVTPVNLYLAAVQYLLTRIADTDDICIGVTDPGRDSETAESIGFFLNLLPLHLRANEAISFGQLVQRVNKTYRGAREHADVPFDTILDKLGVSRDPTYTPLFQVGFDVRHGQSAGMPLGNCQMQIRESVDSALMYDITFCVIPMSAPGPSYIQVLTRSDLYSQEATVLLTQMYTTLLESAVQGSTVDAPLNRLQIYPRTGIQKALEYGAPKPKKFVGWPSTITERVEGVCRDFPATTAITDSQSSMTYEGLSSAIASLCVRIVPYRSGRIAVLCEPQRDWVVSMLATFRIGATFVPLDSTLPPARLVSILRACKPSLILCHHPTAALASRIILESQLAVQAFHFEDTPTNAATADNIGNLEDPSLASLILCTSGTSGVPKATLLSSMGILNFLANQGELQNIRPGEVVLQKSNLGFDMAFSESLLALTHGCTLVIAPQASRGDPVAISSLMALQNVNITLACPTEYLMWLRYSSDALSRLSEWRLALSGGEKVPEALRREMRNLPSPPVFQDAYGPTEISICATMQHDETPLAEYPLTASATSVGRPLYNVGIFIVDAQGSLCPPGVPGEICVSGVGVALGYVDASATAKSFIENFEVDCEGGATRSEGRVYKTGDRGVWREDGTLGYLSRMSSDTVVKIRGLRVDLTDVENAILTHGSDMIFETVVALHQQEDDSYLVAFVVPRLHSNAAPASSHEREEENPKHDQVEASSEDLMQRLPLPRHMKPSRVVVLTEMPLSANGKVDRRQLAQAPLPPRGSAIQQHSDPANMNTLIQVQLHLLWERVLDRTDIPRRTDVDFWAMGGSSLRLVKLQTAIRTEMLLNVSIRDMFQHSTIGGMADLIADQATHRPAHQPIRWDQETRLTDDLRKALISPPSGEVPSPGMVSCSEILLTGADSFLGGHILQHLLRNDSIRRVHCIAVPSSANLPAEGLERITIYEGALHRQSFGLEEEVIARLTEKVDRIIIAGSHGHCLNNYASLRQPNVTSTKWLATWASRRRIPLHFISSSRVTLLPENSQAALPPISVKEHQPPLDGSDGFTASRWASEVVLEHVAAEASNSGPGFPITIHRPCALVGSEAPSEDALNAVLKCSYLMSAVPQLSRLPVSGYFDFAPVEDVAAEIATAVAALEQPACLRFRHYSGGTKVPPSEFQGYMAKVYGKEFVELEFDEWVARALDVGMEPMIGVYLRTIVESGKEMVFPFMGSPAKS
ncbi:Polyketide synthase-nonribosomal peptide synthetase [Lecanosticta acicola]|uniref:Polyketide synthase-nonribosomal peptide synthetase n=1 Tax=Lecanosticta acicola TaxID=111012 RepID=A0AAI8YWC2_9PEZI|nr:Polyketide synthase-nonribosomal peptide synthetase [Lecanosticta acicola]